MAGTKTPRKPAHLEMVGGKSKRQRMWEAIRAHRQHFVLLEIARIADADLDTTKTYLQALEKGGFIVLLNPTRGGHDEKRWQLVQDNGLEAPRLTKAGKPVVQGLSNEQMWRTMRIVKHDFNARELAGLASTATVTVNVDAAKKYLKHLADAGYLTVVSLGKGRGQGGVQSRYQFNQQRYSGPRPPMIQRTKSVYDPNLGKVVWQQETDDDEL